MQLLPFKVKSAPADGAPGVLTVSAPASAARAPPGFYLVFLVAGDLYSDGTWVQVREPAPAPLVGVVPPGARAVAALSSDFEAGGGGAGAARFAAAKADADAGVVVSAGDATAAGAGAGGLRIGLASFKPSARAHVESGAARLEAGRNCTVMLWARGAAAGQTLAVGVVPADAKAGDKPALPMQTLRLRAGRHCLFTLPSFAPEAAGQYRLRLEAVLGPGRGHVDVDDVEVACAA